MAEVTDTYLDKVAFAIAAKCGMSMYDESPRRLLRIYAVLALAKGTETTLRDVHDAWSAWKLEYATEHKSLKPFDELSVGVQELDEPYRAAIVEVAQDLSDKAVRYL